MKYSKEVRLYLVIFVVCSAVFTAQADNKARPIEKQTWWRITTGNFTVISDEGSEVATALATQLEMFRRTFTLFSRQTLPVEMRPVKVISTKSNMAYEVLSGGPSGSAGWFLDRKSGNYAVMRARNLKSKSTRKLSSIALLFHEYTHYLSANMGEVDLPFWYSEGLADYLSTIRFENKTKITYGLPIEYHQRSIKYGTWIPMKTILAGTRGSLDYRDYLRVYPQGWLMVHYFQAEAGRQKGLIKYFKLLNEGLSVEESVQQAFGKTFLELDLALKSYAKTRRLPYSLVTLNEPWSLGNFKVEELSPADSLFEVGEFLLNGGAELAKGEERKKKYLKRDLDRQNQAKQVFERVLVLEPRHSDALAGLAKIQLYSTPLDAKKTIEQAKLDPVASPWVYTVSGHINAELFNLAVTDDEDQKRHRKSAVSDFNQAIKKDPHNVEAIAGAAKLYSKEKRWEKAAELLEVAISIAPSNSSLRKDLIRVYIWDDRDIAAEKEIEIVKRDAHHSDESLERFDKWLKDIRTKVTNETDSKVSQ